MLAIQKKLIKYNYSKRTAKIKYIVIHTTGNTSKGAGMNNHFNYFNGGNRNASADYFVDSSNIGQFVEDTNYSWHCGDGQGKYGITNNNSIGVEICVNSDGDYNKTISHTVDLVKYLMKKYSISISNVVRHYDASRKNCPAEIIAGKNGITWSVFKSRLSSGTTTPPPTGTKYRVVCGWYSTKANAETQQKKLKVAGFDSFLAAHTNNGVAGYRVIAGTYSSKANAEAQQKKLKAKGFDSFLAAI